MTGRNWEATKILIIDDDALVRRTLRNVIGGLGCVVLEADNGNQGMKHFNADKPDLIITDILMPDKEGLETIREMRKADPAVKIIAISAGNPLYRNMQFLSLAEKFGASRVLQKPVKPEDLLEAVHSLLPA